MVRRLFIVAWFITAIAGIAAIGFLITYGDELSLIALFGVLGWIVVLMLLHYIMIGDASLKPTAADGPATADFETVHAPAQRRSILKWIYAVFIILDALASLIIRLFIWALILAIVSAVLWLISPTTVVYLWAFLYYPVALLKQWIGA